jgi:hypothetical protein
LDKWIAGDIPHHLGALHDAMPGITCGFAKRGIDGSAGLWQIEVDEIYALAIWKVVAERGVSWGQRENVFNPLAGFEKEIFIDSR